MVFCRSRRRCPALRSDQAADGGCDL